VLERVDTMNDEVANRLLKTLEEPASFVHLILLTDALGRVLETVVSRCQPVRFEPLPAARIAAALEAEGVDAEQARACAGLALGNAARARLLASSEGDELRREVEAFTAAALSGEPGEIWKPLLERAERRRAAAEEAVAAEAVARLEMEPKGREKRAIERELEEAAKRDGRRARTEVLDLALTLSGLTFRDLVCLASDAPDAVLATDRAGGLAEHVRGRDPRRLREAAERCEDVRQALELNVSEDLALSALGLRLAALAGSPG
jgi:DNA polymerase-3 subunit delta'